MNDDIMLKLVGAVSSLEAKMEGVMNELRRMRDDLKATMNEENKRIHKRIDELEECMEICQSRADDHIHNHCDDCKNERRIKVIETELNNRSGTIETMTLVCRFMGSKWFKVAVVALAADILVNLYAHNELLAKLFHALKFW